MVILDKRANTRTVIHQRLSDGSDKKIVTITEYIIKVAYNDKVCILTFDHDPSKQEILESLNAGSYEESNESYDINLLLLQKIKEQSNTIDLLLTMQLEKEGIL